MTARALLEAVADELDAMTRRKTAPGDYVTFGELVDRIREIASSLEGQAEPVTFTDSSGNPVELSEEARAIFSHPCMFTKEGAEACPWYGKWKELQQHICGLYDMVGTAKSEDKP